MNSLCMRYQMHLRLLSRLLLAILFSLPAAYSAYFTTLVFYEAHAALERPESGTGNWNCPMCLKPSVHSAHHVCYRCLNRPKVSDLSIRSQVVFELMLKIIHERMHTSISQWFDSGSRMHSVLATWADLSIRYQFWFLIALSWLYAAGVFALWVSYLVWPVVLTWLDMLDRKVGLLDRFHYAQTRSLLMRTDRGSSLCCGFRFRFVFLDSDGRRSWDR